jgi:hypothetical protein
MKGDACDSDSVDVQKRYFFIVHNTSSLILSSLLDFINHDVYIGMFPIAIVLVFHHYHLLCDARILTDLGSITQSVNE